MALVAALKDASYVVGDFREVGYAVVAGSEEPGWLLCDGRPVSRTVYDRLFAKIGTIFNTGGEAGTDFRLPDARGRSKIGSGQGAGLTNRALGARGGAEAHALVMGEMPYHNHGGGYHDHNTGGTGYGTGGENVDHSHSAWTDSQGLHAHPASGGSNFGVGFQGNVSGVGTARNQVLGGNTTTDNAGSHAHNVGVGGRTAGHVHGIYAQSNIAAEGGGGGHNNMQPFLVVSVLIKT